MKTLFTKILFLLIIFSIYWVYNWVYSKNEDSNIKNIVLNNWYEYYKISNAEKNNILDKTYKTIDKYDIRVEWHKWVLKNSIKKEKKWEYKLIVRTTLSENEVHNTFNFFDDNINIIKQNNWIYILNIPFNSNIAKRFLSWVEEWFLAKSILNIDIVKPIFVKIDSSSTYLNWENLDNMWWITKMWADKYQEWLSNQTKIKIWIIDTWIDYTHPDLLENKYFNTWEKDWTGWLDDDNNWYIDDINWYDFVNIDNDPSDDHWHGTHVSGIAWWSVNWWWIFWVNSNVDLVWLKVLNAEGWGSSYDIWEAIRYAADNWIEVINMSLWGAWNPSDNYMCDSIDYALSKWTISIVSAWNSTTKISKYVPAWCANAITVAAVDSNLERAYFSNYWDGVDVAAAWVDIYSSFPWEDWDYRTWNWTSMASPFIAWLVSVMKFYDSSLGTNDIKNIFLDTDLTDSVITLPNKKIWRFANMASIMNYLWVNDDDFIWGWEPNIKPSIESLTSELIRKFTYLITVNASDDWNIVRYDYYLNDELIYSWPSNTQTIRAKEASNTISVVVFDDKWLKSEEKDITF